MRTIQIGEHWLPARLTYEGGHYETGEIREVGSYDGGTYLTRGAADTVVPALTPTPGRVGGLGDREASNLRFSIDQPLADLSDAMRIDDVDDAKCLCWTGPKLTVSEFKLWLKHARFNEAIAAMEDEQFGTAIKHLRAIPLESTHWPAMNMTIRAVDDASYTDDYDTERLVARIVDVKEAMC